jgi:hypothetical protein
VAEALDYSHARGSSIATSSRKTSWSRAKTDAASACASWTSAWRARSPRAG